VSIGLEAGKPSPVKPGSDVCIVVTDTAGFKAQIEQTGYCVLRVRLQICYCGRVTAVDVKLLQSMTGTL
jgi:hypothetical protein